MNNKILNPVIIGIILNTLLAFGAHAADHYIRQGATGTGNGNDWTNAYSSWPTSFTRGDTYYIAAGSYPGRTFNTASSGTTPITIKKAIEANHGTSTGWSSTYGTGQAAFNSGIEFTSSYWIIDGQTGGGAINGWDKNFGFKITEKNDSNPVVKIAYSGKADYITISHIDMVGKGSVSNQGGYYSNDAIAIYNGASNTTLSYAWIHEAGRCPIFITSAQNTIFEHLYVSSYYGSSAVHSALMSAGQGLVGDVTFRYNLFTAMQSTGGIMWNNAGYHNAHLYVYGNIFYKPDNVSWEGGNGVIGGWTGGNGEDTYGLRIYNNTFINVNIIPFTDFQLRAGDNVAYNNLFYNSKSPSYSTITTHNFNDYINSGGTHSEANSTSATSGDPFVNFVGLDFRLKADTIGGTTLASPFNTDALGIVRGINGVLDRGAFEFSGNNSATILAPNFISATPSS
jgi:hypothetical protein